MRVEIDDRRRKGENCRRKRHLLKRWSDIKTSPPTQRLMRSRDRLLLSPPTLLERKISTRCFTIMLFTEQWKNPKQRSPYCHIRYSMLFEIYRIWLLCFYQKGVNYYDKAVTLQRGYLCAFIAGGRARRRIHFNRKSEKSKK